jgi:hypothetical protein
MKETKVIRHARGMFCKHGNKFLHYVTLREMRNNRIIMNYALDWSCHCLKTLYQLLSFTYVVDYCK